MNIYFTAAHNKLAQTSLVGLTEKYGQTPLKSADVAVALGGDGHLLRTLYEAMSKKIPVFAMRRTESVGFLCNEFKIDSLPERITKAQKVDLHPLFIEATLANGKKQTALAINEVSIIRETPQSAKLRIIIDGIERIECYSGDGVLVSTPAGSTGYNHSCGGPIMPLDANTLVMTAISGFRPRRWNHAVLPQDTAIDIEVLEITKRPVRIEAGDSIVRDAVSIKIWLDRNKDVPLLFDPEQHLGERIIREQFMP